MPWTDNDVRWVAARLMPEVYDLNKRIIYDRNTKRLEALYDELTGTQLSAIDRIRAKALQAREIAPKAIADFEADLDALIAEGPKLASARATAVGAHKEAFTGIRGELDGLKSAIDLLSNGGPPLEESNNAAPHSAVDPYLVADSGSSRPGQGLSQMKKD